MDTVIKWTGSKRSTSSEIISYFPQKAETYHEPFLGGAHLLARAIKAPNFSAKRYVGSDVSEPLIKFWKVLKSDPLSLYKRYRKDWNEFQKDREYYYEIREEFNENEDPYSFLFLTRTCYNGLIRFNSDGDFNTSVHFDRPGIDPDSLYNVILNWYHLFKSVDVEFKVKDYKDVERGKNDWLYLDPPYYDTKSIYYGGLNLDDFYDWIREGDAGFALSFDGKLENEDQNVFVPDDLYETHVLLDSSVSGFRKLKKSPKRVYESLYVNYKNFVAPEDKFSKFFE